jgi:hypothetical protein
MEKIPASAGWLWIKEGFSLFRRQPAEMSSLFMSYALFTMALMLIPPLGQLAYILLIPVFSMSFMLACVHMENGQKVSPALLLAFFRSPAIRPLLKLGGMQLLASALATAVFLMVVDDAFWQAMARKIPMDGPEVANSNFTQAVLIAALAYLPAAMAFWFAAPLATWQNMSLGKAFFYSFFALWRALKAFFLFFSIWFVIALILQELVGIIAATLGSTAAIVISVPLWVMQMCIMYCSFYCSYTRIFGRPHAVPKQQPS